MRFSLNHPQQTKQDLLECLLEMENRVRVIFQGRVQGVGFRFTVQSLSEGFEVVGYVKNLSDGTVEMVGEGKQEELELFINEILGSRLSDGISDHIVTWSEATGEYSAFGVAY